MSYEFVEKKICVSDPCEHLSSDQKFAALCAKCALIKMHDSLIEARYVAYQELRLAGILKLSDDEIDDILERKGV